MIYTHKWILKFKIYQSLLHKYVIHSNLVLLNKAIEILYRLQKFTHAID